MSNVWHLTSHRARHLAGTQAARAGIYPARGTIHDCFDTLDVGLPSSVGAPVGVRNLNTKRHIFAAKFTFRHVSHLLFTRQIQNNRTILAGLADKCKQFLTFLLEERFFFGIQAGLLLHHNRKAGSIVRQNFAPYSLKITGYCYAFYPCFFNSECYNKDRQRDGVRRRALSKCHN